MPKDPAHRTQHKGYGFITFESFPHMQDAMAKVCGDHLIRSPYWMDDWLHGVDGCG